MRRLIADHGHRDGVVRRGRAAGAAGAGARRQRGRAAAWSPARTGTRSAGRCCRWPARRCAASGTDTDVVTYVSRYTRGRFASAFGPRAALEHLPPGVDTDRFAPDPPPAREMRARYGLGERPVVVCVSRLVPRKGQDMLIRALPAIRAARRRRGAGDRRRRTVPGDAAPAGARARASPTHVVFTGGVPGAELPAHHAMADVFAMPCRTRGAGLDVEGLGIVYLEASATGVPVVAGHSGGAPETVQDGETGTSSTAGDVDADRRRGQATCSPTRSGPPRWAPRVAAGPCEQLARGRSQAARLARAAG